METSRVEHSQPEQHRLPWGPILLGCIVLLYAVFGTSFVRAERPNQDEGWYLYAAKLVGEGQRPYVDFAYVQPPLLPYVYHFLGGDTDLEAGRKLSLLLGALTVLLTGLAAWRAGTVGGLTGAALLGLTPFVLSQQSIVKTYALTDLLLAVALVLALRLRNTRTAVIGAGAALALAALTRNSVIVALPAFWLWLAADGSRRRLLPLGLAASLAPLALGYLPFLIADSAAVWHHGVAHHAANRASTAAGMLAVNLTVIVGLMAAAAPGIYVAVLAGLGGVAPIRREELEPREGIELAALLTVFIAFGHFISVHPYQEYQVLALPSACVLAGLCWGELYRRSRDRRLILTLLVVLTGVVPFLALFPAMAGLAGNRPGADGRVDPRGVFGKLREVAALVGTVTAPTDEVFSFQTDVVLESGRRLSPGLTLASFSFTGDADAERWKMTNPELIARQLAARQPAAVVLSDGDVANLFHGRWDGDRIVPVAGLEGASAERFGRLLAALDRGYALAGRVDDVGQFRETFWVLARREGGSR